MTPEHTWTIITESEEDTRRVAECLAAGLGLGPSLGPSLGLGSSDLRASALAQSPRATVIALDGELGAGKTRFVRGLAGGLGVAMDAIASPTFVLCVEHRGSDGVRLAHIDAWRIRTADDLGSIGWDELLEDPKAVVAIEWASRITDAMPERRIDVRLEHESERERAITIIDRRGDALAERVARGLSMYEPTPTKPNRSDQSQVCPVCQRPLTENAGSFPFCSSRCRMADLNRWFGGRYTISRPIESNEELSD
jgi:tRNA threonylcarbamoyladenosine biosynthesis protein TsaE